MFGMKLSFYRWKRNVYYWLMGKIKNKLDRKGFIIDMIYQDILHTFAYDKNDHYRLYMRNAPINELDLESLWQELRGDYTRINDVDLYYLYMLILDYLDTKFVWYPSVKVCTNEENGIKYFDVYWKNYKQTI